MDKIAISGLIMSLTEKVDELNFLVKRAEKGEKDAKIVKEAIDIIDNKRYSYLCALFERYNDLLEREIDEKIKRY